ncbi:MAG TPA: hypothetical protein VKA79_02245 [Aestuariivirgaceae bacterium]|nr:hypothetical protein [Aestuariivirgaceae bacterium]
MARSTLPAFAFITALTLAVSPGLACERHKEHTAAVTAVAVPEPAPVSTGASKQTGVLISPAAAAAMSVTEALGTEPYDMRCPRMRAREALTQ